MSDPRISRLTRDDVSDSVRDLFDRSLRERGNVPYFFRTMAHRPEIFESMMAHFDTVLNTGTLPKALKELVIVRTSQVNRTAYCLASHTVIAKRLGWTEEQLGALPDADRSDLFTEREKVAIDMAVAMTSHAQDYTDAQFARLREHFTEGEVVELVASVGLFNYFNRANDLLRMEPTRPASQQELEAAGLLAPKS